MNKFLIATAALLFTATPSFAGGAMATAWRPTILPTKTCQEHVKKAMEAASVVNISLPGDSVYGDRQAYSAGARCVGEFSIVFFVVAGPDSATTGKINDAIIAAFKNE